MNLDEIDINATVEYDGYVNVYMKDLNIITKVKHSNIVYIYNLYIKQTKYDQVKVCVYLLKNIKQYFNKNLDDISCDKEKWNELCTRTLEYLVLQFIINNIKINIRTDADFDNNMSKLDIKTNPYFNYCFNNNDDPT